MWLEDLRLSRQMISGIHTHNKPCSGSLEIHFTRVKNLNAGFPIRELKSWLCVGENRLRCRINVILEPGFQISVHIL